MNRILSRVRAMDRQQFETVFTSSAFLITTGLTFINAFILSNGLDTDGRGAVAAAFGNTVVIGWVFQIGVPNAAMYFAKDIDRDRIMMSSWAITVKMALPLAVLLIPFFLWQMSGETFAGDTELKFWYLAFITIQLFNGPFLSSVFYLRGLGNTVRFNALMAIPQALITLGYTTLYIIGELTIRTALTSTMTMLIIGWGYAIISTGSLPGRGYSAETYDQVRSYSLRSWVGNISFVMSNRIDQLLLVNFVPRDEIGIYAVAAPVSTLSGAVARGVAQAMLPFVRNAKSDQERIARVNNAAKWVALSSLGMLIAIAAVADFAVPFVFGEKFDEAVKPLLILLPGAFAADMTNIYNTALGTFDRPEDGSKAQVAAAIATVIGLATLLPTYGIVGAAITTTIAYWVGLIVALYFWRRLLGQIHRGEVTGETTSQTESVS